jgi:hypothetical protein
MHAGCTYITPSFCHTTIDIMILGFDTRFTNRSRPQVVSTHEYQGKTDDASKDVDQ